MKRRKMTKKGSKKLFTATAAKTNKMNVRVKPMRGGFRI